MNVVRNLEKRLERLLEGVVGRAFSGRLHPSEIAGRLAREADFARFEHLAGPATANSFTLTVNPRELTTDTADLEVSLAAEIDRYTADQGLRLEGPATVIIEANDDVAPGSLMCHAEVVPGPGVSWARLVSEAGSYDIGRNRMLIGRAPDMDLVLTPDDVSRNHAALWREGGSVFVRDLGSANGTFVDGIRVGAEPVVIGHGSVLSLSNHTFRFIERDA